jgi:hypothetical protein
MSTNPLILRTPITRKIQDLNGNTIQGATASIVTVPGSVTATIYSAETGTATLSQPLISNSSGSLEGWLEIGLYDITISSQYGTATSRYYVNHPQQSLLQGDSLDDKNLQIKDDGDTEPRLSIRAGGTVRWGSGSVAEDANLYRSGSAQLTTDGAFVIGTNLNVRGDDLALIVKLNKEVFG